MVPAESVFCAALWQECAQKIKIGGYIWLYLVIFTAIWRNSGSSWRRYLDWAPLALFLVFFFVEVSDKGKPVPPPSRWLAAGRAIVAVNPARIDRTRVISRKLAQ